MYDIIEGIGEMWQRFTKSGVTPIETDSSMHESVDTVRQERLQDFANALYDLESVVRLLPAEIPPEAPKPVPVSPELLEHITGMDGAAVEAKVAEDLPQTVATPAATTPETLGRPLTDDEERAQRIAAANAAMTASQPMSINEIRLNPEKVNV